MLIPFAAFAAVLTLPAQAQRPKVVAETTIVISKTPSPACALAERQLIQHNAEGPEHWLEGAP